ncbi:MAG: transglycosylase domain-containing protein, partial [Pseudomonadota bacterium]
MANTLKTGLKKPPPKPAAQVPALRSPIWVRRRWLVHGLGSALVIFLIGLLGAFLYWQSLYNGMPTLPNSNGELWRIKREPAVEFVDRNGDTLAIRGPRYGRALSLADLPPHVPRAFIAAEDKRFFEHDGADTQAMLRALISNAVSGRTVSGASTLTQQLVKNLLLSSEQTLKRKVQEIRLARQLETRLSKDEILELYLNRVYFGSGFYGVDAASRHYFGKPPENLTLAEASILATLPQAPSRLALYRNMDEAKERQGYVLREMVSAGFVTRESARIAADMDIELSPPEPEDPTFGYLLDQAFSDANDLLPNVPEDLIIQLTIDPVFQAGFAETIDNRLSEEAEDEGAGQAAAVLLDQNGQILALYGGRSYAENQFNRALQARRQPGSAFKPFVYAAALEN